jgi:hypothetical protein
MTIGHLLGLGIGFAISCYGLTGVLNGKIRARTGVVGDTTYTRRKSPRQFWFFVVNFVLLGIYIMYRSIF